MKMPATFKFLIILFELWLVAYPEGVYAAIDNRDLLDSVLTRFSHVASGWATSITNTATWLFWTLATISMIWTFGIMALRKADIAEFFAELVRFTIFTGFFWWLLTNGPTFSMNIMESLQQVASTTSGFPSTLSPSNIVDIGFSIFDKVAENSTIWSPVQSGVAILMSAVIMVLLALVGVNMLLLLISGWILAYAGIFFLGFGGSRWTSDIAINYYKTALSIGAQLLTMVLLVGIGRTFINDYYTNMSSDVEFGELAAMLVASVVLLVLVNKLPALISGIVSGASVGGVGGIGQHGASSVLVGAHMARASVATTAAMLTSTAGSALALSAAISKAYENVNTGSDVLTQMFGGGGQGPSNQSANVPLTQIAGATPTGASSSQQPPASSTTSSGAQPATATGASSSQQPPASSTTSSGAQPEQGGNGNSGVMASMVAQSGLIAIDAAANLAKGVAAVAKNSFGTAVAETTGGKIAAAIKSDSGRKPIFDGNHLAAGKPDKKELAAEAEEFANRKT